MDFGVFRCHPNAPWLDEDRTVQCDPSLFPSLISINTCRLVSMGNFIGTILYTIRFVSLAYATFLDSGIAVPLGPTTNNKMSWNKSNLQYLPQNISFQSTSNEIAEAVKYAIDRGYRHFDTAYFYQNESDVGGAIKEKISEGVVKREDIFLTTKVSFLSSASSKQIYDNDYLTTVMVHPPRTLKGGICLSEITGKSRPRLYRLIFDAFSCWIFLRRWKYFGTFQRRHV